MLNLNVKLKFDLVAQAIEKPKMENVMLTITLAILAIKFKKDYGLVFLATFILDLSILELIAQLVEKM